MKNKIRPFVCLLCMTIGLFATSCVDGFKDKYVFSSGVTGDTLKSLIADSIKFTPSADGATVKVSWPVVYGAGGYKFSFYKVDDPTNPVVIGTENQIVDGCSVSFPLLPDTKYKAVIQTLGNTKYNNKDAVDATTVSYSTYSPANAVIPAGTDLYQYFQSNPIPNSTTGVIYELEAGGTYTMTGNVPFGTTPVTIRGDKVHHATVTMSTGVFLSDGAGINIKTIDFDCTNFTGASFITFNATLNSSVTSSAWGGVIVNSPVTIQSCKITGLASSLIYDNAKKYALQTFLIKDCVIGQNTTSKTLISMAGGLIKDLTISNSTIYDSQIATGGYLIQYANSTNVSKITGAGWASGSVTLTNSTFWQVYKTSKMANYSGMSQIYNTLTVQKCIFIDSGNQRAIRDLAINTTMVRALGYNSYWFGGVFASAEISTSYDNSSTYINTDPQLKNPAGGDFTVGGAAQITAQTGDPRWLSIH